MGKKIRLRTKHFALPDTFAIYGTRAAEVAALVMCAALEDYAPTGSATLTATGVSQL